MLGFYYPLYYLQLDASVHGLGKTFSFYCVRPLPLLSPHN